MCMAMTTPRRRSNRAYASPICALSVAQRLHLAAPEHEPGLDGLEDLVVAPGPAVGGHQLGAGRAVGAGGRAGHGRRIRVPPASRSVVLAEVLGRHSLGHDLATRRPSLRSRRRRRRRAGRRPSCSGGRPSRAGGTCRARLDEGLALLLGEHEAHGRLVTRERQVTIWPPRNFTRSRTSASYERGSCDTMARTVSMVATAADLRRASDDSAVRLGPPVSGRRYVRRRC